MRLCLIIFALLLFCAGAILAADENAVNVSAPQGQGPINNPAALQKEQAERQPDKDLGLDAEYEQGPLGYVQDTLSLQFSLLKKTNVEFDAAYLLSYSSASAAYIYTGIVTQHINDNLSLGLNAMDSPESGGIKAEGWGLSGEYEKDGDAFSWDFTLKYNNTLYSEYYVGTRDIYTKKGKKISTVHTDGWHSLDQTNYNPTLELTFFEKLGLQLSYSKYEYNKNPSEFSQEISNRKVTTNSVIKTSMVSGSGAGALNDGFADNVKSAGISYKILDNLKPSFTFSKTFYAIDTPEEDSFNYAVEYTWRSKLKFSACYELDDYSEQYYTFGVKWLW